MQCECKITSPHFLCPETSTGRLWGHLRWYHDNIFPFYPTFHYLLGCCKVLSVPSLVLPSHRFFYLSHLSAPFTFPRNIAPQRLDEQKEIPVTSHLSYFFCTVTRTRFESPQKKCVHCKGCLGSHGSISSLKTRSSLPVPQSGFMSHKHAWTLRWQADPGQECHIGFNPWKSNCCLCNSWKYHGLGATGVQSSGRQLLFQTFSTPSCLTWAWSLRNRTSSI